ncbi:HGxxPAAW family protein [Calidifontibacter terrae]
MTQEHHDNEGKSVASWTAVWILLVAATVIGFGVMFNITALWIIGAVLVLIGVVAGKALTAAGFGSPPHAAPQALADEATQR